MRGEACWRAGLLGAIEEEQCFGEPLDASGLACATRPLTRHGLPRWSQRGCQSYTSDFCGYLHAKRTERLDNYWTRRS